MRCRDAFLLPALIGLSALAGCANARHVKTDSDSGVVAMPANTNIWPTYYRDHAEALMRQKCPAGYEVVCEEEAVVGQVTNTHTKTDVDRAPTLNLGGASSETNKDGKTEHGSSAFAGLGIPLGKTHEKTEQTVNSRNVTEWRIYYRAKPSGSPTAGSSLGTSTPVSTSRLPGPPSPQ